MRSTLSNALLKKALKFVLLKETISGVYVSSMNIVISDFCDSLEETLNCIKSLKPKNHISDNVPYWCSEILVDVKRLKSARSFKQEHLGNFTCIFEDTSKISGMFTIINRLWILFRNFVCVTRIPSNLRSLLHMSPLVKRMRTNTATLLNQIVIYPIITIKSLKMIQSTRLQSKSVSKSDTVGNTTTLIYVYLPSQFQLVKSVAEMAISKGI